MGGSITSDDDAPLPTALVSSILGLSGPFRFRHHGSTQKPHLILRRVVDDDSDDDEPSRVVRFSLFAQKRIEVKPGKEILLSVATEDDAFKDIPLVFEVDLDSPRSTKESKDEAAVDEKPPPNPLLPPTRSTLPPHVRRRWHKKVPEEAPFFTASRATRVSIAVQATPDVKSAGVEAKPEARAISVQATPSVTSTSVQASQAMASASVQATQPVSSAYVQAVPSTSTSSVQASPSTRSTLVQASTSTSSASIQTSPRLVDSSMMTDVQVEKQPSSELRTVGTSPRRGASQTRQSDRGRRSLSPMDLSDSDASAASTPITSFFPESIPTTSSLPGGSVSPPTTTSNDPPSNKDSWSRRTSPVHSPTLSPTRSMPVNDNHWLYPWDAQSTVSDHANDPTTSIRPDVSCNSHLTSSPLLASRSLSQSPLLPTTSISTDTPPGLTARNNVGSSSSQNLDATRISTEPRPSLSVQVEDKRLYAPQTAGGPGKKPSLHDIFVPAKHPTSSLETLETQVSGSSVPSAAHLNIHSPRPATPSHASTSTSSQTNPTLTTTASITPQSQSQSQSSHVPRRTATPAPTVPPLPTHTNSGVKAVPNTLTNPLGIAPSRMNTSEMHPSSSLPAPPTAPRSLLGIPPKKPIVIGAGWKSSSSGHNGGSSGKNAAAAAASSSQSNGNSNGNSNSSFGTGHVEVRVGEQPSEPAKKKQKRSRGKDSQAENGRATTTTTMPAVVEALAGDSHSLNAPGTTTSHVLANAGLPAHPNSKVASSSSSLSSSSTTTATTTTTTTNTTTTATSYLPPPPPSLPPPPSVTRPGSAPEPPLPATALKWKPFTPPSPSAPAKNVKGGVSRLANYPLPIAPAAEVVSMYLPQRGNGWATSMLVPTPATATPAAATPATATPATTPATPATPAMPAITPAAAGEEEECEVPGLSGAKAKAATPVLDGSNIIAQLSKSKSPEPQQPPQQRQRQQTRDTTTPPQHVKNYPPVASTSTTSVMNMFRSAGVLPSVLYGVPLTTQQQAATPARSVESNAPAAPTSSSATIPAKPAAAPVASQTQSPKIPLHHPLPPRPPSGPPSRGTKRERPVSPEPLHAAHEQSPIGGSGGSGSGSGASGASWRDRVPSSPPPRTWKSSSALSCPTVHWNAMRTLQGDGVPYMNTIEFSSDGRCFVSTCSDKTIRIWDCEERLELARLTHHQAIISAFWLENDAGVIVLTEDGLVSKWMKAGAYAWVWARVLEAGDDYRSAQDPICFAYARDRIAVSFPRMGVKVWILTKGVWQAQRSILRQNVTAIKFIEGGETLLGGTRDGALWCCDVPNGTLRAYAFLGNKIISLDVGPGATDVLVGVARGTSMLVGLSKTENKGEVKKVYNLGKEVEGWSGSNVFGARFATKGQAVLYGHVASCTLVWDRKKGSVVYGLEHDEGAIIRAVATVDACGDRPGCMVTATKSGQVCWWDLPVAAATQGDDNRSKK